MSEEDATKSGPTQQQLMYVLRELTQRLVDDQGNLPIRLRVAEVLRQLGRNGEAVALYQSVLRGHAKAGQLAEAIAISKLILEIDVGQRQVQQGLLADLYARNAEAPPLPTALTEPAHPDGTLTRGERMTRPYSAAAAARRGSKALARAADEQPLGPHEAETATVDSFFVPGDELRPTQPYEAQQKIALEIALHAKDCPDEPMPSGAYLQGEEALRAALGSLEPFASFEEDELSVTAVPPYPLLSHLDRASFLDLVDNLERRSFVAGEWVIREGDPGDTLFLLCAGRLEVLKESANQDAVHLAVLKPGSFLGEFGLLADSKRHASVRCQHAAELLLLERDRLDALLIAHPAVETLLWRFYRRRLLKMVIENSPLFRAVDEPHREIIADRFSQQRVEAGQWVVREGLPQDSLFVVLLGNLTVLQRDADSGTDLELRQLSEGDYFGEMSLLLGKDAEASVRTNQVCELLVLPHADFYEICAEHPALWEEIEDECRQREIENISVHGGIRRSEAGIL